MQARGRFAFFLLFLLAAGCRSNDLVENELRARDNQLREALHELGKLEARNNALQGELQALRQGNPLPPEQAAVTFGLKRIVLGRGTSGYDNDGLPGDEALQVVVEPRDGDDHTVKTPGILHIDALEVTPQGLKKPLCWWEFGPEQLRNSWKQGLLSTGYTLLLPWTAFPKTETVRVVVQMKLSDGRVFEADRDVKVRLVPGAPTRIESAPLTPLPLTPTTLTPTPLPVLPEPRTFVPAPLTPTQPPLLPEPTPFVPGKVSTSNASPAPIEPTTRWTAAPLEGVVQIGRPIPLAEPKPAPLP